MMPCLVCSSLELAVYQTKSFRNSDLTISKELFTWAGLNSKRLSEENGVL